MGITRTGSRMVIWRNSKGGKTVPDWEPAMVKGKAAKQQFVMPVMFDSE